MLKMAVYLEANAILGSSLSPKNYCICKITALNNGADPDRIQAIVPNAANNRLLPVSALQTSTVTYTIRFLDWDGTVLKTEQVVAGSNPTPPANPTRSGYTFNGWSPAIGTATQNQDYTATYTQNSSGTQYHIVFAKNKTSRQGFYFYMNNGTFVPISNRLNISANDVLCIAYLSSASGSSYLIDNRESDIIAYTNDVNQYNQYSYDVYTHRSSEYASVLQYMLNSPVVSYCNNTFNGDGQVPTDSQLYTILYDIESLNDALSFIGADTIKTNTDIGDSSDDYYYKMTNKYWSRSADYTSDDDSYVYGMIWVGGYSEMEPVLQMDPNTHQVSTVWVTRAYAYPEIAESWSISARVRAIKPINDIAPEVGTDIYYEYDVAAGTIPECPSQYTPQDDGDYVFTGWNPTLYAADKDQIYISKWQYVPPGGDANSYAIYAKGDYDDDWVPSGGTIHKDVNNPDVSIMWTGPEPADNKWDVRSSPAGVSSGVHSWGSGWLGNVTGNWDVIYTVFAIHPVSGGDSQSISGNWSVSVHTTGL